ncbi:hypothetical protein M427DRAFT_132326 [Gonapodya prolifera JEL478]|uniref:Transcription initiation factor TFIID subunit 1 histone acetyltransferase domain-containing protein n=1 Tax=Gonapodya prolifera (strain JEL478) TaxID=1344416 RepID=A0A139AS98_GONPJ|nr:hypothetical protein M427DRAFT_132326 [Gonapodya prolifera JEL478]|eukprot:KXS19345.1 hypothetical protein M427DRAFT_132326 [Gonapodya prolifera JEL478]
MDLGHDSSQAYARHGQPQNEEAESVQAMLHLLRGGRMRFSDFLQSTRNLGRTPGPQKKTISRRVVLGDRAYVVEPADKELFASEALESLYPIEPTDDEADFISEEMEDEGELGSGELKDDKEADSALPFPSAIGTASLVDWEDFIGDGGSNINRSTTLLGISSKLPSKALSFIPDSLPERDWTGLIMWDEDQFPQIERKRRLLFEQEVSEATKKRKAGTNDTQRTPNPYEHFAATNLDRFNIGNDRNYESGNRQKANRFRQPLGQIALQHAIPALKLQGKSHKMHFSIADKRTFHRPPFKLPLNVDLQISHVRGGRKKAVGRETGENVGSTKELGLKDGAPFVLLEYSEEYPPLLNNLGMVSLLHRYYRKTDETDNRVVEPEEYGSVYVLDTMDQSPFFGFGDVAKGDVVPGLYNNMFRAPVFRHDVRDGEFLLIREVRERNEVHRHRSESKYYIREVPAIFLVGQTLPSMEVPGPTSRKGLAILRNRMQVFATRLQRANPQAPGFKMDVIAREFTGISDMQLRQKLKEFAHYNRRGEHSGYWRVREDKLSEEELQKLVTPEQVCAYQSMTVGQQRLRDAGYGYQQFEDGEEAESELDIEVQLAPWNWTRNFIWSTQQQKFLLQLNGDGDPTGIGEGFSFMRKGKAEHQKSRFLEHDDPRGKAPQKASHAETQMGYKKDIERIWEAQRKSLSDRRGPQISDDKHSSQATDDRSDHQKVDRSNSKSLSSSMSMSPAHALQGADGDLSDTETGSISESLRARGEKILVITRQYQHPDGTIETRTSVIEEVMIARYYTQQREEIERSLDPNRFQIRIALLKSKVGQKVAKKGGRGRAKNKDSSGRAK